MSALNKTLLTVISIWVVTTGSAFAETNQIPEDFNYNIGAEVDTIATPNDVDIELVSRICADELDRATCLGEGLAQAIE